MRYIQVRPPEQYFIRRVHYSCNSCNSTFVVSLPHGNEVVKYVEPASGEERWLPTFGKGGYLHLIEQLLPDFEQGQEVTMEISRRFEMKFAKIQRPSKVGISYKLFIKAKCPSCESADIRILDEITIESPSLEWMEYRLE